MVLIIIAVLLMLPFKASGAEMETINQNYVANSYTYTIATIYGTYTHKNIIRYSMSGNRLHLLRLNNPPIIVTGDYIIVNTEKEQNSEEEKTR